VRTNHYIDSMSHSNPRLSKCQQIRLLVAISTNTRRFSSQLYYCWKVNWLCNARPTVSFIEDYDWPCSESKISTYSFLFRIDWWFVFSPFEYIYTIAIGFFPIKKKQRFILVCVIVYSFREKEHKHIFALITFDLLFLTTYYI